MKLVQFLSGPYCCKVSTLWAELSPSHSSKATKALVINSKGIVQQTRNKLLDDKNYFSLLCSKCKKIS